jgi:hypothetical protein
MPPTKIIADCGDCTRSVSPTEPFSSNKTFYTTSKLTTRLREQAEKNNGFVDFVTWINCLTVDIIGDMAFSEDLGSLDAGELQPSLHSMFKTIKIFAFMKEILRLPSILVRILTSFIPSSTQEAGKSVTAFGDTMRDRRLASTEGKTDFMSYLTKNGAAEGKG